MLDTSITTGVCDRCDQDTVLAYAGLLPPTWPVGWGKYCGPCWEALERQVTEEPCDLCGQGEQMFADKDDLWTIAQTIYGEARGEPHEGQVAVAWVIVNRQRLHPRWHRKSLAAICKAPYQFSCWNAGDPNRAKIEDVALNDHTFAVCVHIAVDVLTGRSIDSTYGATHYYAATTPAPRWAVGKTPSARIGHHLFFANIA